MNPTSISLLEQIRIAKDAESEQAWQRLHEIYTPLIRNWLQKQSVVGVEADDLAQEVMIVVMRKVTSFEHNGREGAFRRWLRLIVVNCARDFWKTKRIRPLASDDNSFLIRMNELADDSSELTGKWNLEHDLAVMQQLLEQVRPMVNKSTWRAFEMTTILNRSPESVAKELGISVASVYTGKSRVLSRLRKIGSELLD